MTIEGNIVDVVKNTIFLGKIEIENGKIVDIKDARTSWLLGQKMKWASICRRQ